MKTCCLCGADSTGRVGSDGNYLCAKHRHGLSLKQRREWAADNRERLRSRRLVSAAKSRRLHKAKYHAATLAWKMANPEKHKECATAWRRNNKPAIAAHNRRRRLAKYGLTVEQYDAMSTRQKGRCAICRRRRALGVDHCHKSKVVRALLCRTCNLGIGQFSESPRFLRAAADYVEQHAQDLAA